MQESKAIKKSSRAEKNEWSGNLNWEEAKLLAIDGWREGLKQIEKYTAQITPRLTDRVLRPIQAHSINGYSVDVGAFLANDPECFITRALEERNYPGRIYKIVCSIAFSASIKPITIIQRGAIVCALIDALEFAGHRAEVVCNHASSKLPSDRFGENKERGWFEIDIKIKASEQPLDMSSLAFCLAHPAMLRRIVFSAAESVGWSDFTTSYGYPAVASNKGDLHIREIFSDLVGDDMAVEWLLTQLKKLGIDVEER